MDTVPNVDFFLKSRPHSITSSASASRFGGMVSQSGLAVVPRFERQLCGLPHRAQNNLYNLWSLYLWSFREFLRELRRYLYFHTWLDENAQDLGHIRLPKGSDATGASFVGLRCP
jgi:hypothetical protein